MVIIFIGGVVTIIGAFIVAVGTYLQNKSSSFKSDSILANTRLTIETARINKYKDFWSAYKEYEVLAGRYHQTSFLYYIESDGKEQFFKKNREQIEQFETDLNEAIENILKCKFVTDHPSVSQSYRALQWELNGKLYFLKFPEGSSYKRNDEAIVIDRRLRDTEYDALKSFLHKNSEDRRIEIERLMNESAKEAGL